MKKIQLIDHIQTAVALIDKDMKIVEANDAFQQRNKLNSTSVVGTKCFNSAYKFNHSCSKKTEEPCPLSESFKTKKSARAIHHFWIDDHAVVEEVTTTPVIGENGEVDYVIEEFRDITKLLGLEKGIMGICSYCRKIRNEDGEWLSIEIYLQKRTGAKISHGICEECNKNLSKELENKRSHSH
jgi:transcriptional regulator with PAS, ATPase and Fis domain